MKCLSNLIRRHVSAHFYKTKDGQDLGVMILFGQVLFCALVPVSDPDDPHGEPERELTFTNWAKLQHRNSWGSQ